MTDLLIIEDEASLREVFTMALRLEGFEVCAAGGAQEALKQLETFTPDLVILDLSLPQINGWDLLALLRERCQAPVLVMTANTDETTRRRAHHERVDGLLFKPVGVDEILKTIQKILA
jgi:DNA-binding response OmpR family regulator